MEEEKKRKVFYVGFPDVQMMSHKRAVPFEVLEENETTLRIRLLEDEPPFLEDEPREGLENIADKDYKYSKAGDEFTIQNSYRRQKLTEYLQRGRIVAPYYVSEIGEGFGGVIFSYNPNKKEEQ